VRRAPAHSRPPAAFLAGALLLFGQAACGTSGEATDGLDADAVPRFELEEQLRIGSLDDPEIGFSSIADVALDRDGNVFVGERSESRVRVYDASGLLVRTIGGAGGGPGEFQYISSFGVVGDTLWVYDSRARRTTLFDREGTLLTTIVATGVAFPTPPEYGVSITIRPTGMREDGLFSSTYGMSLRAPPSRAGADTLRIPRLVFDATGAVVDTLGFLERPLPTLGSSSPIERIKIGEREYPSPRPPSAEPLRSTLDDGQLIVDRALATSGDAGVFTVTRIGPWGDTLFQRHFRYRPRSYDEAIRDTLIAGMVGTYGGLASMVISSGGVVAIMEGAGASSPADAEALERAYRDALVLPPLQPPVAQHRRGEDGSYWLRREEDAAGTFRWLVLNEDGSPRGEVRVPRRLSMYWTDGEQVWGAERDEFDVPWLVKYRIVEAKRR